MPKQPVATVAGQRVSRQANLCQGMLSVENCCAVGIMSRERPPLVLAEPLGAKQPRSRAQ